MLLSNSSKSLLKKYLHLSLGLSKDELCKKLEADKLVRISDKMLEKYLDMYASDESVELSELQLKALDKLYQIGYEHNMWDSPIKTKDYLIPKEYEELRRG